MEPTDFFISPDLLKQAQELNSNLLKVPDDAFIGKGDTKRWTERLQVTRSSVDKLEGSEARAFRVGFKVSALSDSPTNRGRNTSGYYSVNLKPADDKEAFITKLNIARLDSLLRAVGFEFPNGEQINYGKIFSDPDSIILGAEVNATLVDKPDKHDPTMRRQEISRFTPVED